MRPVHVAWQPRYRGELAVGMADGSVALAQLRDGGGGGGGSMALTPLMAPVELELEGPEHDEAAEHSWCGVAYGAHPRTVLRAGAGGLWLADARAAPAATLSVYQVPAATGISSVLSAYAPIFSSPIGEWAFERGVEPHE